jgi:protease secretion system outer membrane protein
MTEFFSFLQSKFFSLVLGLSFISCVSAVTIDEAFNSAVKVDPALRSSRYNQEASSENIAIARSRLLPQISLQGSSNQLTQSTTHDLPGNTSISKSFTGPSSNHQLVIRQALLRPKERAALNFAELQAEYGKVKYQSDLSELWFRVAYAWIDLVGAAQLVDVYKKPLISLQEAAKQENARFMLGDGTKDLAAEAEAQSQLAHSIYRQALQSLSAKQKTFFTLTQIEPTNLTGIRLNLEPKILFSEYDQFEIQKFLKDKSFDLRLAEIQLQLQRERLRMAQADHLPTLDALATWSKAKNDATSTQGYQYKNNQMGIQYVIPIYAGGATSAGERQAALSLESSTSELQVIANKVETDFQFTWSTWVGLVARVQSGTVLIKSSSHQLNATVLANVHGVKSVSDVANSELALAKRIADQINLVIDYQKYTLRLSSREKYLFQ